MKKIILGAAALVFVLVVAGAIYAISMDNEEKMVVLEPAEAKAKMTNFINDNLMQAGSKISVKEFSQEKGLYKAVVNVPGGQQDDQEVVSYMTLDGSQFFPQAYDVAEIEEKRQAQDSADQAQTEEEQREAIKQQVANATAGLPQQDKPTVELFVMSHCPYGTQMEKGMLPVMEALGDAADFQLKFCDYAMHGEKEVKEQMNQYCIQKNEPEKLLGYLECFLGSDDGEGCLDEAGINRPALDSCVASVDSEYGVTEKLDDKSTWKSGKYPVFPIHEEDNQAYGITGSPGLVVNGKKIQSGRNAATLLGVVCAGFEEKPEACSAELSVENPSPGFGFDSTAAASSGSCD